MEAVIDGSEAAAFLALCHFMAVLRLGHFIQVDDMEQDHYLLKGILVNHSSYTSCDPGASHLSWDKDISQLLHEVVTDTTQSIIF